MIRVFYQMNTISSLQTHINKQIALINKASLQVNFQNAEFYSYSHDFTQYWTILLVGSADNDHF